MEIGYGPFRISLPTDLIGQLLLLAIRVMSISVPLWLLLLIGFGLYYYAYKQAQFRWKCKWATGKIHTISHDTRGRLFDLQGLDAPTKKYIMDEGQWENIFDWERPPMNPPHLLKPHRWV